MLSDVSETKEYKVALTLEEAMGIIKEHEVENTVRFSAIFSTKGFGNISRFNYFPSLPFCFHFAIKLNLKVIRKKLLP